MRVNERADERANARVAHYISISRFPSSESRCKMGRTTMKLTPIVLGHSLVRSLVHSHCTLIRLLRTARFTRAFRCAHSFERSLARPLTRSRVHGKEVFVYELNASTSCSFNGGGHRGGKKQFFPLFPLFFCVFLRGKLTMRK